MASTGYFRIGSLLKDTVLTYSDSALAMDFVNLEELENKARVVLPKMVMDYYQSGAETEQTVQDNRGSFNRYRILPRILVDVSRLDTSCTILGGSTNVAKAPMFQMQWPSSATITVSDHAFYHLSILLL